MNKTSLALAIGTGLLLLLSAAVGISALAGGTMFWITRAEPTETTVAPATTSPAKGATGATAPVSGGGAPGSASQGGGSAIPSGAGATTAPEVGEAGEGTAEPGAAAAGGENASCADKITGVTQHSETHYTLSADFMARYVRDQDTAARQGSANWRQNKKKETVGLRISGLRCAPRVAGLKNGDVIRTINDRPLTSSTAALMAYNDALHSTRLVVGLRRNGESMTIRYDVQ